MTGGLHGGSGSGGTIVTNADGFSTVRGGFGDGGSIGVGEAVGNGVVSTITRDGIVSNITTRRIRSSLAEGMGFGGPSGAIVISKDGGEIVIDNVPNGAALHTGGGRIAVGRSEGRVTASTGGGDIELEDVTGDASATTGAGDVRINVVNSGRTDHSINVESGSGRVVIEVPSNLDARIELESAYTDNFNRKTSITSDFSLDRSETDRWDWSAGTPRKYIRANGVVGNGRGLIRIHTVNGDVVLKRVNP